MWFPQAEIHLQQMFPVELHPKEAKVKSATQQLARTTRNFQPRATRVGRRAEKKVAAPGVKGRGKAKGSSARAAESTHEMTARVFLALLSIWTC